jgi:nicotinate-nucleotide adenylyltransferase
MTRVGLFGGSFNPVHLGHIRLAEQIAKLSPDLDEVWLNISPANPLKRALPGATDADRLAMLQLACAGHDSLRVCDVEFHLPRPSFTINTLKALSANYPDHQFAVLIGADNWLCFDRWRAADEIIANYGVTVYPRQGSDIDPASLPAGVRYVDAPLLDISSTELRQALSAGNNCALLRRWLPATVIEYISTHHLYNQNPEKLCS